MSRGASILNAPITLADLIIAGMAAAVVWQYVKPYDAPGLGELGRRAGLAARAERDTVHAITGQRSEPDDMSAERIRGLVEQDGREAHAVDRAARRPVRST